MATGATIVEDAFLEANIIGAGEVVSAEDQTLALRNLNRMLESWANENLMIYSTDTDSFLMTPNQADYSTSLLPKRPVSLYSIYVRLNNIDYPVDIIDQQTFQAIPYKLTPAIPSKCFYNASFPNGTFNFYPRPYTAFTCFITSNNVLSGTVTASTQLNLPPGYEDAIVSNLAVRLCGPFEKTPHDALVATATASKAVLKRNNYDPLVMGSVMDKQLDISNAFIYKGF